MEQIFIYTVLAFLGLIKGSYAGAKVWRLRARQLKEDKVAGEVLDKQELRMLEPLTKSSFLKDRSRCLHCNHTLAWYDLLPLVSWTSTGGKCRYCKKPIGWFEPVIELGTAFLFVISYAFWPVPLFGSLENIIVFGLWLAACVMLVILFAYDAKWCLLPNRVVFPLMIVGLVIAILKDGIQTDPVGWGINLTLAIVILSGIYFVLWAISKGTWIGLGDVKLGLALALLLGQWPLAFVALFAANIIGCLIVLPGMLSGKVTRKTRVPFGPLLIAGAIIAMLWGQGVVDWYFMAFI